MGDMREGHSGSVVNAENLGNILACGVSVMFLSTNRR